MMKNFKGNTYGLGSNSWQWYIIPTIELITDREFFEVSLHWLGFEAWVTIYR
jgi:hypothetical protein